MYITSFTLVARLVLVEVMPQKWKEGYVQQQQSSKHCTMYGEMRGCHDPANSPVSSKNCTMGAESDHLQEDPWISCSMHEADL